MPEFRPYLEHFIPIQVLYSSKPLAIRRDGGLGDIIMSLPVVYEIRKRTKKPVHYICPSQFHDFLRTFDIIVHKTSVNPHRFSHIIDLNKVSENSPIRSKHIPRWELYTKYAGLATCVPSITPKQATSQQTCQNSRKPGELKMPEFKISKKRQVQNSQLKPYIAVVLRSKAASRTWRKMGNLAKILSLTEKVAIISQKRLKLNEKYINLTGLSLIDLAVQLQQAKLLITTDTGILHLGMLLNLNIIALFGNTDPKLRLWRKNRVQVIQSQRPCVPCHERKNCKDCLEDIEVETVLSIL